jgi:hypothetical protein
MGASGSCIRSLPFRAHVSESTPCFRDNDDPIPDNLTIYRYLLPFLTGTNGHPPICRDESNSQEEQLSSNGAQKLAKEGGLESSEHGGRAFFLAHGCGARSEDFFGTPASAALPSPLSVISRSTSHFATSKLCIFPKSII